MTNLYRHLPAMDEILGALAAEPALAGLPRPLVREWANRFLDACRENVRDGSLSDPAELSLERLRPGLLAFVRAGCRPHFRRVLNATGVVIHTNLGRSILAAEAMAAVADACAHYSNLEFSLDTGERGSRYAHVEGLLTKLTGAEAALVVNNNAAAVFLILDTLARGREVVVSRGQLVEIGGSFRIPDVMARSGAKLVEVGATNRTHARDYENAITEDTAALMRVHTSNYRIIGFTAEVSMEEMAAIGRAHGIPVIEDLGSGALYNFGSIGFAHEPTVQEAVAAGLDVVSFSGDKVLGGPQAGIIAGRKEYVDRIKRNPLNRALRIDKMTLAALEATLRLYLDPELARQRTPTLRMITARPDELHRRAANLRRRLVKALPERVAAALTPGVSRVGGGSFPERDLATTLVALRPLTGQSAEDLRRALLATDPPLVGRIEADAFCLDPRTLTDDEFGMAIRALNQALAPAPAREGGEG